LFDYFVLDTEGSFIVDRVVDIASAAIKHLENVTESADLDESGKHFNMFGHI
jgi:hypothetical protein